MALLSVYVKCLCVWPVIINGFGICCMFINGFVLCKCCVWPVIINGFGICCMLSVCVCGHDH